MPPKSIMIISEYDSKMVASGRALIFTKVAIFYVQNTRMFYCNTTPNTLNENSSVGEKETGSLEQYMAPGQGTNSVISKLSSGWMEKIAPTRRVREWHRLPAICTLWTWGLLSPNWTNLFWPNSWPCCEQEVGSGTAWESLLVWKTLWFYNVIRCFKIQWHKSFFIF